MMKHWIVILLLTIVSCITGWLWLNWAESNTEKLAENGSGHKLSLLYFFRPSAPKHQALMIAASKGDIGVVKTLVRAGASVKDLPSGSRTPLHEASVAGNPDIVQFLISAGAVVDAKMDPHGRTPLMMASGYGIKDGPVVLGIDMGGCYRAAEILIEAGADVNYAMANGGTALGAAATYNRTDIIILLLNAGADPDLPGFKDRTPLHHAASRGRLDAAAILLDAGSSTDALDQYGLSPIQLAQAECPEDIREAMIELLQKKKEEPRTID